MIKTTLMTLLALIAFAANSVLCRMALGAQTIDPYSFTAIRLLSGIATLLLILGLVQLRQRKQNVNRPPSRGSWRAAAMLFAYALAFSVAYMDLQTGVGALILFTSVQMTMIAVGFISGQRPTKKEGVGLVIAMTGFVYFVSPGLSMPPIAGLLLMILAGMAWGGYTLAGKRSSQPLSDTAFNFLRTLPIVIVLLVMTLQYSELSQSGIVLAVLSGALASGVGYALWYAALSGLSAIQAAVLQLTVPIIATVGGVVFVNEPLTLRLVISAIVILGGIFIVVQAKAQNA